MTVVCYDGSFDGLFTAVFEIYECKIAQPFLVRDTVFNESLFGSTRMVTTNTEKSNRVAGKLKERLSPKAFKQIYDTYLSDIKDIDNVILRYIQYAIASKKLIESDYGHEDVLMIQQTARKVQREKHRMEAFVRFELTKDQLYYCIIQPDYNVLPLMCRHFKDRYADQRWLIYDSHRKYGLYYDVEKVAEVQINFTTDLNSQQDRETLYDESEVLYQQLWKQYFSSVNIAARKNMKLHIRHMPKRYWRYLTEKK